MRKPHNKHGKRPKKNWDKPRDDRPRDKDRSKDHRGGKGRERDRDHDRQREQKREREQRHEQHAERVQPPGRPMLYGFHAVRAAWLNPERYMQALYLTEQSAKNFEETLAFA